MNDPLFLLGQSLAEDFQQNLSQWLPVESLFNAEELFGSIESTEGIILNEEKWIDLSSFSPSSKNNFVPEDLVAAFFETPYQDQRSEELNPDLKAENRSPFSSSNNESSDRIIRGNDEIQNQPSFFQNDDDLNEGSKKQRLISGRESEKSVDESSKGLNPILRIEDSFFRKENSPSKNEQRSSSKNVSDFFRKNEIDENENQQKNSPLLGDSNSSLQQEPNSKKTSFEHEVSNSIWSAPLHNLSDFAGIIGNVGPEKNDLPKATQNAPKPSLPEQSQNTFASKQSTPKGHDFQEGWFVIPDPTTTQNDLNLPPSAIQQSQALPPAINGTSSENLLFPSIQEQSSAADPDELLEALTERILRDFHRYYP